MLLVDNFVLGTLRLPEQLIKCLIIFLLSYLCGSIPFGYILPKVIKGIDIRKVGSGNIGATNVARAMGIVFFPIVLCLDALKGFVPVFFLVPFITKQSPAEAILFVISGASAIAGHIFPVFLGFKGGRGVATGAGVVFAINWLCGVIALAVFGVILICSRYVSLSSIVASVSIPICYLFLEKDAVGHNVSIFLLFVFASILVIIRHRQNIIRIIQSREPRVW